ncbi:MAG: protein-export chaperone SecB [Endozoicomonadaceae bacterium]|nr:protein-export chaperone SecB [Endozoicomonadaceae bacterium]MBE8233251.1 protein-export chaperone SecB [Endozoicomonadaceae bacterium]
MNESKSADQDKQPQFAIQRVYVKDLSFESPKVPQIFKTEWNPEVKLDLSAAHTELKDEEGLYEVVLSITVTVTSKKTTAFIAEIKQAGIFTIKNIPVEHMQQTLSAFCPNILFPYARETIDNMIIRGSFPPIMLAPVNFDALLEQAKKENKNNKKNDTGNQTRITV